MSDLFSFWSWVYGIAAVAFAGLVLLVIPLGARDLVRLFRKLSDRR